MYVKLDLEKKKNRNRSTFLLLLDNLFMDKRILKKTRDLG